MSRHLSAFALVIVSATPCFAQDPCQTKPGSTQITVTLQNNPNSFEPTCEPSRIRVPDRTPVTIIIKDVSPTEVCLPNQKPPTPTTVTNPLESIINTVTGFKSFDFAAANSVKFDADLESLSVLVLLPPPPPPPPATPRPVPPKSEDELALELFHDLAKQVYPTAQGIADKQTSWQNVYKAQLDQLSDYAIDDYRGRNWGNFDPDGEPDLKTIRDQLTLGYVTLHGPSANDPPSEMDYAPLQAIVDQMKSLQGRLTTACTLPTKHCDPDVLSTTARLYDKANTILTVAQDNLKSLQSSQAAIASSFAVLHKMKHDFGNLVAAGKLTANPDGILTQSIVLGTDYGETSPSTIACSTDTTPAIPTTDTINVSILYQNVPALTVSAGLLVSFIEKNECGVTQVNDTTTQPSTADTIFAITDSARASVVPMAYVNYRFLHPTLKTWWGQPNSELVISHNVSAGIGINANTGTSQPEFFAGYAVGFSRSLVHAGLDYGRQESLGGGFSLGKVPTGFTGTAAPINWSYRPGFAFGLSVRIAPF